MTEDVPIRDAASVILVRDAAGSPSVLMGQRGRAAVFMPEKFVFPGGRVDALDFDVPLEHRPDERVRERLNQHATEATPEALAVAAIRETYEETGLVLGVPGLWPDAPEDWSDFAAHGVVPDARQLSFFFRAITPPGRPRRFDARFFVAPVEAVHGNADVPEQTEELSNIQWVPLDQARKLNLAFITQLVLAELARHLPSTASPERVPFVRNDRLDNTIIWL